MDDVIRSGRFYNWPIIIANVIAVGFYVGAPALDILRVSIIISLLASFGYLINDICDRDVDLVNKAGHFEESNSETVYLGAALAASFLIIALAIACTAGGLIFYTACLIATGLASYSLIFRRLLLLPTLLASVLATSPIWTPLVFWGQSIGIGEKFFLIAVLLMMAGREILMDTRDRLGDKAAGRSTFATVFGSGSAKRIAVGVSLIGSLFLAAAGFGLSNELSLLGRVMLGSIVTSVVYLVVEPSIRTLSSASSELLVIDRYVLLSRFAMALLPLFSLIVLWRI